MFSRLASGRAAWSWWALPAVGSPGWPVRTSPGGVRRTAVLAAPVLVPTSMALMFDGLARRLSPHSAYNVGFGIYWLGWCGLFPCWVLGPRRALGLLQRASQPRPVEAALLAVPVIGGAVTQLLPQRHAITPRLAAVMLGSAVVNAVGEELLWRGVFVATFPGDVLKGAAWPLAGFTLWHLAPQRILPSRLGRWRFVAGAALVGAVSTAPAWRTGGLFDVVVPHALTDACGVDVARFRVGDPRPA
jgi:CAAX prenyl protease-like protein